MIRGDLIDLLVERLGATRYLEIGVNEGVTFDRIRCPIRVGVDPGSSKATVHATSDHYFERLIAESTRFDLVFVDGLHTEEQVVRDVENALAHLSDGGAVVVHDCNPPTETYTHPARCGSVYRGWIELRRRYPDLLSVVVDIDLGCGVLIPSRRSVSAEIPSPADWTEFEACRVQALGLVSWTEFLELVPAAAT